MGITITPGGNKWVERERFWGLKCNIIKGHCGRNSSSYLVIQFIKRN